MTTAAIFQHVMPRGHARMAKAPAGPRARLMRRRLAIVVPTASAALQYWTVRLSRIVWFMNTLHT